MHTGKRANGSLRVWLSGKKGIALTRQRELIIWSSMLVHGMPLMGARGELAQTDGVAPYLSHKRQLSRNNTSMEMTCRCCNPGLPACLALLRRASVCRTFHIRRDNKQWLSLNCCETVFDLYCQDTKCVQQEPSFLTPPPLILC